MRIAVFIFWISAGLVLSFSEKGRAMTALNDDDLKSIEAQAGPITLTVEKDTVRLFLNTYMELYQETDAIRCGYYYKTKKDLVTRKALTPGEPGKYWDAGKVGYRWIKGTDTRVLWNVEDTRKAVEENSQQWVRFNINYGKDPDGNSVIVGPQLAYEYEIHKKVDGEYKRTESWIPWLEDDNYMAKYKTKAGQTLYADGAQGDNSALLTFSKKLYRNRNYLDWDLNLENVRMGNDPSDPIKINGLVIRLKYDKIDSPDRRITDVIVGSNDVVGDIHMDYKRATGVFNPKLPHQARRPSLQTGGAYNSVVNSDLGPEFNKTPIPVRYQRDTMMAVVDHIHLARNYKQPEKLSWQDAVPDNPLHNTVHTGFFVRIGLDRSRPHFGFQLIGGYNERVATAFQYRGEFLNDSMYRWWNGKTPRPETNTYPQHLNWLYGETGS